MAAAQAGQTPAPQRGAAAPRTEVDQLWERILGPPGAAASCYDALPLEPAAGATYASLPQVTLGVAAPRALPPALQHPPAHPQQPPPAAAPAPSPAGLLAAHLEAARAALQAQPPSTLPVVSPSREARDHEHGGYLPHGLTYSCRVASFLGTGRIWYPAGVTTSRGGSIIGWMLSGSNWPGSNWPG